MKTKLEYKQAYLHDTIRPEKVLTALQYLKNHNPEYSDININENWIKTWQELDEDVYDGIFDTECTVPKSHAAVDYTLTGVEPHGPTRSV